MGVGLGTASMTQAVEVSEQKALLLASCLSRGQRLFSFESRPEPRTGKFKALNLVQLCGFAALCSLAFTTRPLDLICLTHCPSVPWRCRLQLSIPRSNGVAEGAALPHLEGDDFQECGAQTNSSLGCLLGEEPAQ